MRLDIDTPKGQISLQQEQKMLYAIEQMYGVEIVQTDKAKPCEVDGFIVKRGVVIGVFESKCRNLSIEQLRQFDNEWLITFDKILAGLKASQFFKVPYYGFLYLVDDDVGIKLRMSDDLGNLIVRIRVDRPDTQKSINGGSVIRTNAYVDVSSGVRFPIAK